MYIIGIDPGHGGSDSGAVGFGYREKDIALKISLILRKKLQDRGFKVVMSRDSDYRLSENLSADLSARANIFNQANCHAVLSIHLNSAQQPAWGMETYTWDGNTTANRFGDTLHQAILNAKLYGTNRGRKYANYAILRETDAVAALVETAFINSDDVYHVAGKEEAWASTLCNAICTYFNVSNQPQKQAPSSSSASQIISKPSATLEQMQAWASKKGAAKWFIDEAKNYYEITKKKGVNPTGVYAQSAIETGYGNFGGVIDESYHNPCGMKITAGGGNYDPNAHKRFKDWEEGITAQVDHLLLYAGQVQKETPDPRHFPFIQGKAKTWQGLGGNWAPSIEYGNKIVRLMQEIEQVPKTPSSQKKSYQVPEWAINQYEKAKENGFTDGTRLDSPPTRLEMALIAQRVYEKLESLMNKK